MKKVANRPILVTGATGRQGGAVLRHLRARGFPTRALTRNPGKPEALALVGHGTEVVAGDLNDEASLNRALEGMYGVYSVQSSSDVEQEVEQGIRLAEAARRAVVDHFVYSSVGGADQNTGVPFIDSKGRIEEHIRKTGLVFTIVRPVFFMENWLGMKDRIDSGTLALPWKPETRLQMVAVDDIGAFVTMAFEHRGSWLGRTVNIASDELPVTEIAEAFGRASGRDVKYVQIGWDEFEQQAGRPVTLLFQWLENTTARVDIPAVRAEYPGLTSFDRWLNLHWRAKLHARP